MEQNRDYFKEQEEYVANNYMSANGENLTPPVGQQDLESQEKYGKIVKFLFGSLIIWAVVAFVFQDKIFGPPNSK